jgi:hypothetical protein
MSEPVVAGTPPEPAWTVPFKAWVWSPPRSAGTLIRQRGFANASLTVYPGGFSVRGNWLERRMFGWEQADYLWPTVVIETLTPARVPGLLFDIAGRLARCAVPRYDRDALTQALARADLTVIEVRHSGWEAPHSVPRDVLGTRTAEVPSSIIEAS